MRRSAHCLDRSSLQPKHLLQGSLRFHGPFLGNVGCAPGVTWCAFIGDSRAPGYRRNPPRIGVARMLIALVRELLELNFLEADRLFIGRRYIDFLLLSR